MAGAAGIEATVVVASSAQQHALLVKGGEASCSTLPTVEAPWEQHLGTPGVFYGSCCDKPISDSGCQQGTCCKCCCEA